MAGTMAGERNRETNDTGIGFQPLSGAKASSIKEGGQKLKTESVSEMPLNGEVMRSSP